MMMGSVLMLMDSDRNGSYVLQRTSKLPPWDLAPSGKPPGGWPLLLLSCPFLSISALCNCAILTPACSPSRRYGTSSSTKPPLLPVLRYRWTASWCMRTQSDRHTLGRCLRNTPHEGLLLLRICGLIALAAPDTAIYHTRCGVSGQPPNLLKATCRRCLITPAATSWPWPRVKHGQVQRSAHRSKHRRPPLAFQHTRADVQVDHTS